MPIPISPAERLQRWIHILEEGAGKKFLQVASTLMGFIVLALIYNLNGYQGFSNPEAMESAQLGRQLAQGKGFTTESIRPLNIYLLQLADPLHAQKILDRPVPDLANAPGYPALIATLMKIVPFNFKADRNQPWFYAPDLKIVGLNEAFFFVAVLLLYQVAVRLFDAPVAWLSCVIFAGTELYWKFCVSGLSTMWMVAVFLAVVLGLVILEERERRVILPRLGVSVALAAIIGALVGVGGLSRYSFAWMIVPVILFLALFCKRARGKMCVLASLAFLTVMGPWLGRNFVLGHHVFGTAGYAIYENTPLLMEDKLERSLNPEGVLARVSPRDIGDKFVLNARDLVSNGLPRLGGNWASAFFLCGLLLPFRSPALKRFRYFLLWSLLLFIVVQSLGQTHVTTDAPEINSENLLALLAPLVFVFGAGAFFTLLDPATFTTPAAQKGVVGFAAFVASAPLLLALTGVRGEYASTPYAPAYVQRTAAMMEPDELMMSDIPWAVAWYGMRPCTWLTLNDGETFKRLNEIRPLQAVYLTQRTTDKRFYSQMIGVQGTWENFYLESLPGWGHGEVPTGFPLQKAPLDYAPAQMFISDRNRWQGNSRR